MEKKTGMVSFESSQNYLCFVLQVGAPLFQWEKHMGSRWPGQSASGSSTDLQGQHSMGVMAVGLKYSLLWVCLPPWCGRWRLKVNPWKSQMTISFHLKLWVRMVWTCLKKWTNIYKQQSQLITSIMAECYCISTFDRERNHGRGCVGCVIAHLMESSDLLGHCISLWANPLDALAKNGVDSNSCMYLHNSCHA